MHGEALAIIKTDRFNAWTRGLKNIVDRHQRGWGSVRAPWLYKRKICIRGFSTCSAWKLGILPFYARYQAKLVQAVPHWMSWHPYFLLATFSNLNDHTDSKYGCSFKIEGSFSLCWSTAFCMHIIWTVKKNAAILACCFWKASTSRSTGIPHQFCRVNY